MDDNKKQEEEQKEEYSLSPILSTRYAYKAAKMICLIAKNFLVVIGIVAAVLVFATVDVLQEQGYIKLFTNDTLTDTVIVSLVSVSLAALAYAFRILIRSRNMLKNWANLFEQNSIRSGMSIAMADKSKEGVIRAIAEVIEEIGEPLRKYIVSKENLSGFFDVTLEDKAKNRKGKQQKHQRQGISFDVLIDSDHVLQKTTTYDSVSYELKETLKKYGGIVIKIVDGTIDKSIVQSFSGSISDYISMSKNNKVGLALMIGDDVALDASKLVRSYNNSTAINKKAYNIILIEKPVSILSGNNNSSATTTDTQK